MCASVVDVELSSRAAVMSWNVLGVDVEGPGANQTSQVTAKRS